MTWIRLRLAEVVSSPSPWNKSILWGNFSFNDFCATIFLWKVQIMHWRTDEWKSYCEEGNHVESDSVICSCIECSASKRLFMVSSIPLLGSDQVGRGRGRGRVFNTRPCHWIVWLVIRTKCPSDLSPGQAIGRGTLQWSYQGSPGVEWNAGERGYTKSGSEMTLWL